MQRALAGDVLDLSEIDQDVDEWHSSDATESLAAWLGMTDDEYALFVERSDSLRVILAARKQKKSVRELLKAIERDGMSLAARGASDQDAEAIRAWLEKTGRL